LGTGGGGSGCVAIGTQPMAAARANGSQAATEAMLCGGMTVSPAAPPVQLFSYK